MKQNSKLSLILVLYNTISKLDNFFDEVLDSVFNQDYGNFEVIFIDNASTDGTLNYVRRYVDKSRDMKHVNVNNTRVVNLGKNYGVGGGYNIGALQGKDSCYFLFINHDLILNSSSVISKLVSQLEDDPSIGVASPLVTEHDNSKTLGFKMKFFSSIPLKLVGELKDENKPIEVFSVSGACMITRTDVFFRAGMFDQEFFYGLDDIDYCWRVRLSGSKVVCLPNIRAYHLGRVTLGRDNPISDYYNTRNLIWMYLKNYHRPDLILVMTINILGICRMMLMKIHKREIQSAKCILKGLIDGVKRLPYFIPTSLIPYFFT